MMIKYRVSDVAKDLGVSAKEVVDVLAKYIDTPKKAATALVEEELDIVFDYYTQKHQVANLEEYFAKADKAREEKAVKEKTANTPAPAPAENKKDTPVADGPVPAKKAESAPKKEKQPAPARAPIERRTVDTRTPQMNVGNKYDEKFDVMAQTSNRVRGDGGAIKKQKINQKSQQYKKPQRRHETEA